MPAVILLVDRLHPWEPGNTERLWWSGGGTRWRTLVVSSWGTCIKNVNLGSVLTEANESFQGNIDSYTSLFILLQSSYLVPTTPSATLSNFATVVVTLVRK